MKIALLGYGVVGGGVYKLLEERQDIQVKYVLDLRELPELGEKLTRDYTMILNDPEVELVAEAMGGLHPAYEFASAALQAGKHYVTANKHLVCEYYRELTELAAQSGVALRCSAAVGGGIPWLSGLARARRADRIVSLRGIMNGTTNYILDAMHKTQMPFAEALSQAQQLGYAEVDPSADIDGLDVQRKLVISCNTAFDAALQAKDVPVLGIRRIQDADIAAFLAAGYVCKLMAHALRTEQGVTAYVEPTLVTRDMLEAAVSTNYNLISFVGENYGLQSFFGQGAGRYPTAANIVQDCLDIQNGERNFYDSRITSAASDPDGARHSYYVRTAKADAWLQEHTAYSLGAGVVTVPVSVQKMHDWAAGQQDCFVAGIFEPEI